MDIAETRKVTKAAAEAIALALCTNGEIWSVDADYTGHGEIISNNIKNQHLGLHLQWNDKDRIEINGAYNFTAQGLSMFLPSTYSGERQKAEITVARRRPAEAIAKEIRRRLMPQYLHNLEHALKAKESSDNWKAGTRDKLKRIQAALEKHTTEKIYYSEDNDQVGRYVECYKWNRLRLEHSSDDLVRVHFEVPTDRAIHFIENYLALTV